jgi:hypothetical protein
MEGHGTTPETRAFAAMAADVRAQSGRNFGDVLVHHTRKEGGVSGAWEGTGDTLLRLSTQPRRIATESGEGAQDGGNSFPGFMIPAGSSSALTARNASSPPSPTSAGIQRAWSRPTAW